MSTAATEVFEFVSAHPYVVIERHEVSCPHFLQLRRSVRRMALVLSESDNPGDADIAAQLRIGLFELLSSPLLFRPEAFGFIDILGTQEQIRRHWGSDIERTFRESKEAVVCLAQAGNRLRDVYLEVVRSASEAGEQTRIYCHRAAIEAHMVPEISVGGDMVSMINTPREYRESPPFDILIKVGPLRGRGWGAVPDAVITASRFRTLRQIVWEGSSDESEFGYDPASVSFLAASQSDATGGFPQDASRYRILVAHSFPDSGFGLQEPSVEEPIEADDFAILNKVSRSRLGGQRPALLVQIDDRYGIFYYPMSRVMSFDPGVEDDQSLAYRIPGDSLEEGMYVLFPVVDEFSQGVENRAQHGTFSRHWKGDLAASLRSSEQDLVRRLRTNGLDLLNLHAALHHWVRDPTTVIHAPQQRRHFEILIQTLGVHPGSSGNQRAWIQRAWAEIMQTRGEAIGSGMSGHAAMEQEILDTLAAMQPTLRQQCVASQYFRVNLPESGSCRGYIQFFPVRSVESGYRVPDTDIRLVLDLAEAEKWRG